MAVQCENTLFEILTGVSQKLGFEYCAYGLRVPLPMSRPEFLLLNNYPKNWQKRYYENDYLKIDPTVHHGLHSLQPIVWEDHVFSTQQDFWEEAQSFGLHFGWAQSCRDVRGVAGMLSLARSNEPLLENELRKKDIGLSWLSQTAHIAMSHILLNKASPVADIYLTEREITVLQWSADGKTSSEISEILGISDRTVSYHIRNAIGKLGANNKVAATVKAAILGLLY
jgi:LuxR family transcriptional regulator